MFAKSRINEAMGMTTGWNQQAVPRKCLKSGKLNNTLVNINYVRGEFEGEIKPILNYKKMESQPNAICGV